MTKKQMIEELEKRMVAANNEYDKLTEIVEERKSKGESIGDLLLYAHAHAYGEAVAFEVAWKIVRGE